MNEEVRVDPARVFVLVGVYPTKSAAEADQKTVKKVHASDMTGKFETTVIARDEQGQVHVSKGRGTPRPGPLRGWSLARFSARSSLRRSCSLQVPAQPWEGWERACEEVRSATDMEHDEADPDPSESQLARA